MRQASAVAAAVAAAIAMAAEGAAAASFGLVEHGVSGLGNAYSGGAAIAEDPTTVFFNPAGMTRLSGTRASFAVNYIKPSIQFKNQGSNLAGRFPISGGDAGDGGDGVWVPNAYLTHAVSDRVTLGLGIDVPFGLVTDYSDEWVGRYHAVKSDLKTINVNPSIAVKLDHGLSVGAGVSALYTDVTLTSMVDVGALAMSRRFPGATPGAYDAKVKISGDDWSFGYSLGLLYELSEQTRFGMSYRKWFKPKPEGDAKFDYAANTPAPLAALGYSDHTEDASAEVSLPDSLSVSAYHALTPEWAVMADVTWTNWSRTKSIPIELETTSSELHLDYKDSWRYGLGLTYTPSGGPFTWRVGVASDEEPIRSSEKRGPRLPANDRIWLALGANYRVTDKVSVDFGYAHLFVDDAKINNTNEYGHTLKGDYDLKVDIVGLQLNWQM